MQTTYFQSTPGGEPMPPVLGSPHALPGREPLRHLLIGSREGITATIHQLHALRYAEQFQWSTQLAVPPQGILILPQQGEALSYLIRYRAPAAQLRQP